MKLFDIRLSTRITAATLFIMAAGTAAFLFHEHDERRDAFINERNGVLEKKLWVEKLLLNKAIGNLRQDVLFLSNAPAVSDIARMPGRGYDARHGNAHSWRVERVQQIFSAFLKAHPEYYKIRFIGAAGGGREIVHTINRGEKIEIIPFERLQTKGDADYFKAALALQEGLVYLSDINLNRAWGVIERPYRPTLRAATPVFSMPGKISGVVVINMDVNFLLKPVILGLPPGAQTYITNSGGQYLLHPDPQEAFAFELGGKGNIAADFPSVKAMFTPQTADDLSLLDVARKTGEYAAASRIRFDPAHPERFLLLMYHIPDAVANREIVSTLVEKIAWVTLVLLLVSGIVLFTLRRTFSPLDQLAGVADRIAAGEQDIQLPEVRGGEIGSLVKALDAMMSKLTQREKLLQESEARSRIIMETIDEVFWMTDITMERMHYISPSYERVWGRTVQSLYENPRSYIEAIHPEERQRVLSNLAAMHKGEPFEYEYRIIRPNGEIKWIWDRGFPVCDKTGKAEFYAGIAQDITEHKQVEAIHAKMENASRINIAGETTASMAHELSQPLTACNNYLDVCLRRMDDQDWCKEKLKETLRLACEQAERAGKIMSHFRGTVRKQETGYSPIDINLLIMDVSNITRENTKNHGVSIRMALSPVPQITACGEEIRQVLFNLYENATEAMRSSAQRELCVTTCAIESGHILVTVGDSGEGIPPSRMATLFEPFHSSKKDSLGLGLSICHTFIEKHGGRIWADPQRKSGAEFYFTLPLEAHHV